MRRCVRAARPPGGVLLRTGSAHQVASIDLEDVEHVEADGVRFAAVFDARAAVPRPAALKAAERRDAGFVQGDDLAVQNHTAGCRWQVWW